APRNNHCKDELDAHPLVREHSGERLRGERPDAWKAGHERLYEHLKGKAEHRPGTLVAMAPLFQAVHHGCQAGRRQEALDEVYEDRIVRKGEFFLTKKLGAFGAGLGLVASFFDPPFAHPAADLREGSRAWLLNQAAFRLRALGRLGEAVAPMRAALEMASRRLGGKPRPEPPTSRSCSSLWARWRQPWTWARWRSRMPTGAATLSGAYTSAPRSPTPGIRRAPWRRRISCSRRPKGSGRRTGLTIPSSLRSRAIDIATCC
ncbi:MAG: hypothetical protein OEU92_35050, partial [Alphaproteobacteria bacterium]|nr:hypothetical protein [Alphaproteobacteria bacterium]